MEIKNAIVGENNTNNQINVNEAQGDNKLKELLEVWNQLGAKSKDHILEIVKNELRTSDARPFWHDELSFINKFQDLLTNHFFIQIMYIYNGVSANTMSNFFADLYDCLQKNEIPVQDWIVQYYKDFNLIAKKK